MRRPRHQLLRWAALALGVAAAPDARPDAFGFRYEPRISVADVTTTDQAGSETRSEASAFEQQYFLTLDRTLFPRVRLSANGSYQLVLGAGESTGQPDTQRRGDQWNFGARLNAGDEVLRGSAYYTVTRRASQSMANGVTFDAPTLQTSSVGFSASWRPADLPEVQLLLGRDEQRDLDRVLFDQTSERAALQLTYQPERRLDLRARGQYQHSESRLTGTENTSFSEQLRVAGADQYLDQRVSANASYFFSASQNRTNAPGGQILIQRFPFRGLSAIDTSAQSPTRIELAINQALVDGQTAIGAALNIGFGPSVSGDIAYREMGVEFTDEVTAVSVLYLWVNKALPAAVVTGYSFRAFWSANNLDWIEVPVDPAGVSFAPFENRFEIRFAPGAIPHSKYVKIVTRPLAVGVTTDDVYRDVQVTELQTYDVVSTAGGDTFSLNSGAFSGAVHANLVPSRLSYDFSLSLNHNSNTTRITWGISNALAYDQPLGEWAALSARLNRSDGNSASSDHFASTSWSASIDAAPMPTLSGNLSYTGQLTQSEGINRLSNSAILAGRAVPYRGMSLYANAAYAVSSGGLGDREESGTGAVGFSLIPNVSMSVNGNFSVTRSRSESSSGAERVENTRRADGSASWTPAPALSLAGTVGYVNVDGVDQVLYGFAGSLSPFPGGSLILTFRYNENADTLSDSRSRVLGPYVRWNISKVVWVEGSYTYLDVSSRTQDQVSNAFNTTLSLTL